MNLYITNIIVPLKLDQKKGIYEELKKLGLNSTDIIDFKYSKRSIDSRKKSDIKLVYNLEVQVKDGVQWKERENIKRIEETPEVKRVPNLPVSSRIAIVGTGPAGLFAAYNLCKNGYKPVIFERGEKVQERDLSIDKFIKENILNPDSNIQFGEGGAGTYSDGKLNTRIKSGYINEVFSLLVKCGAQEEILWDYKPHIGTDILKKVVVNLREEIISMGGTFHFNSKLTDIFLEDNRVKEIEIIKNSKDKEIIPVDFLILGIGHSARETYRMLHQRGALMESKPFAVGARIEHPRVFIDKLMHGKEFNNPLLGSGTYSLTYNSPLDKRGVFSFCMCPGGVVVNAASHHGGTLVNGMSYSHRKDDFSNSALVVSVRADDFGDHLFAGMEFQEKLEQKAYKIGGYCGLYQNTEDFLKGKVSTLTPASSYQMKLQPYDLNKFFPKFIVDNMKLALEYWNKTHPGFVSKDANLIGPETRTSAPVKILRDELGESLTIKGLYPIGEGAGYAGGITSAAVDGLKITDLAFTKIID